MGAKHSAHLASPASPGSPRPLRESLVKLLGEKTALSPAEVEEEYRKWSNHTSGQVTREQFRELMQQCYPRTYQPQLEEDIFRLYDLDNNGSIDFKEFLLVVSVMDGDSAESKLRQIFRIFDTDQNGVISKDEVVSIVSHLFHLLPDQGDIAASPEKVSDMLMTEMDSDCDGVVTEDELIAAFLRQERLTSILINKLMQRFVSSHFGIEKL